jgi:sodium transport system permease protein
MKWANVKLIFLREAKDQLRDRRTLFTIAVLPVLLYPLLGMTFMQISQFMREHPTRVWVIGSAHLPQDPPLILDGRFAADFASEHDNNLLELVIAEESPADLGSDLPAIAREKIRSGQFDTVLIFDPGFGEQLDQFRRSVSAAHKKRMDDDASEATEPPAKTGIASQSLGEKRAPVPGPEVIYNTADDKSRIAFHRLNHVLQGWRRSLVEQNLKASLVPVEASDPFNLVNTDVAEEETLSAATWSKVLPFILIVWALTGAFYPAIDLCAGEKERGTLETLLSSPAMRSEIVWGKLLTVMMFSMATSLLNLLSMGMTGFVIYQQLSRSVDMSMAMNLGPPPLSAVFWLVLALIPISALFSALALAIAAFARSSKEGQYYLLPLLMIMMPLMMLPLLPSAELDLGTSLIPVSGLMMLLRSLIEGQYGQSLAFLPPVVLVTGACCLFAVRWAVHQFQNESVLFRESERFGVGLWMRHLIRDRADTPNVAEAIACGVLLLMIRFFAGFMAAAPAGWPDLVVLMLITQVVLIAGPPVIMASFLTRSPTRTLSLRWPTWKSIPAAILVAVCLHPSVLWLAEGIQHLYPISAETVQQLKPFTDLLAEQPLLHVLLLMALAPAICEELAFRGFILSGLRGTGRKWTAILISSLFFGLAHGLLQQSLAAFFVGIVIGFIAVQTGSLLPAIAYHFTHNALAISISRVPDSWWDANQSWTRFFVHKTESGHLYHWPVALLFALAALALLQWFRAQPYQRYDEESLQERLNRPVAKRTGDGAQASVAG